MAEDGVQLGPHAEASRGRLQERRGSQSSLESPGRRGRTQTVFRPTGPDKVTTGASGDTEMGLVDRVLVNIHEAYGGPSAWKEVSGERGFLEALGIERQTPRNCTPGQRGREQRTSPWHRVHAQVTARTTSLARWEQASPVEGCRESLGAEAGENGPVSDTATWGPVSWGPVSWGPALAPGELWYFYCGRTRARLRSTLEP